MRPTVEQLRAFYASPPGKRVARSLARKIAPVVRRNGRSRLLALGYCAPVLRGLNPRSVERLALVMPFAQGVHRFPATGANCSCLAEELSLPFAESLFDQALLCHALEFVEPPRLLLRELWRVLAPEGELIAIVPNRTGLWPRLRRMPFRHGIRFGRQRLDQIVRESMFEPLAWTTALAAPVPGIDWVDRVLPSFVPPLGGVHILLARKSVEAARPCFATPAPATVPAFQFPGGAVAAPSARHFGEASGEEGRSPARP